MFHVWNSLSSLSYAHSILGYFFPPSCLTFHRLVGRWKGFKGKQKTLCGKPFSFSHGVGACIHVMPQYVYSRGDIHLCVHACQKTYSRWDTRRRWMLKIKGNAKWCHCVDKWNWNSPQATCSLDLASEPVVMLHVFFFLNLSHDRLNPCSGNISVSVCLPDTWRRGLEGKFAFK